MSVSASSLDARIAHRTLRYRIARFVIIGSCQWLALGAFVCWALTPWFDFSINLTQSLPGTLYVTLIGAPVKRGDLVAFYWRGGATYPQGVVFIKRVMGVAGDVVTVRNGAYFVNDTRIGVAKPRTRAGVPLAPARPGVIQPDSYFVATPHPDSLDSRYVLTGNVPRSAIQGRAYEIF
ncbi:S26 family signal peptidase [Burkholderia sp. JSH-S8]|uniref:S26 family signal peptidase n=1 Tax=Burkholderia stagnalis TaxID=1503054 RepID=UPI001F4980CE|nr:S26 family signal peptidase [Burkholderia stagnalis]WGS45740.1 S26 family signal peptidase [Burkholderia sp. JSH-S8]